MTDIRVKSDTVPSAGDMGVKGRNHGFASVAPPVHPLSAEAVRRLLREALGRPAQEGARLLALHWLYQLIDARQAWQTLPPRAVGDEGDPATHEIAFKAVAADTLHKARVALRRLRATLKEHASILDDVANRRARRALRVLSQATNELRDSDVQRAWLEAEYDHLPESARPEADRLREYLAHRSQRVTMDVESAFIRHLDPIVDGMLKRLGSYHLLHHLGIPTAPLPYAHHLATCLADSERRIRRDLERLRDAGEDKRIHDLRIHLKRQRALLSPFAASHSDLGHWFDIATRGQDLLGATRDAHLLARQARKLELTALAAALHAAMLAHHAAFISDWVDRPDAIAEALSSAIAELQTLAQPRSDSGLPLEIERKLLLNDCPPVVRSVSPALIEQGWLPGKVLRERLRRRTEPDGTVSYWRTIKFGPMEARIEVEEITPADLFCALWPLTRLARVRKHRYTIVEGSHRWEIDVFLNRQLVLAEIELRSTAERVEYPDWLAPYVVRDVTGDSAYLNIELARPEP